MFSITSAATNPTQSSLPPNARQLPPSMPMQIVPLRPHPAYSQPTSADEPYPNHLRKIPITSQEEQRLVPRTQYVAA